MAGGGGQEDDSDKSHEPSEKKLRDARRKGEIPRSADVTTATAYGGLLLAALLFAQDWVPDLGAVLTGLMARAPQLGPALLDGPAQTGTGALLGATMPHVVGWVAVPGLLVLLVLLAQQGIVFAPSKLEPKAQRLSPLANARNKFGRAGLFEFAKSFAKLVLYSVVLGVFLRRNLDALAAAMALSPMQIAALTGDMLIRLLVWIVTIAVGLAVIDFLWQRAEFTRRNRMSHKEMRDEHKEAEGDPMMKSQRRARAQEIALNSMLRDVPKADVVIVNPTHYAVALQWSRTPGSAPVCVASGVDEIARRIRELAADAGVPIHSDPPTARALHAAVNVGQEVPVDLYAPVAVAIRFAEDMRQRARHRRW